MLAEPNHAEKKRIDDKNHIGWAWIRTAANLPEPTWCRWSATSSFCGATSSATSGVLHYGEQGYRPLSARRLERASGRACAPNWKALEKALPPQYPFLQVIRDNGPSRQRARPHSRQRGQPGRRGPAPFPEHPVEAASRPLTTRQRAAGTGRSYRQPGESADRARDREPHLAASFRPGHRAHAQQLRPAGRPARAIPNCWIISPAA